MTSTGISEHREREHWHTVFLIDDGPKTKEHFSHWVYTLLAQNIFEARLYAG